MDPELFTCPLWIHLTSSSGVPVGLQVILTGFPLPMKRRHKELVHTTSQDFPLPRRKFKLYCEHDWRVGARVWLTKSWCVEFRYGTRNVDCLRLRAACIELRTFNK